MAPATSRPPARISSMAGGSVTFTHGLGAAPMALRTTLYCAAADAATGYSVGDEIEANTGMKPAGVSDDLFLIYSTATTVLVVRSDATGTLRLAKKSTG